MIDYLEWIIIFHLLIYLITHTILPAVANYNEDRSEIFRNEDYQQAGVLRRAVDGEVDINIPLGKYFREQLNIKPLLPYEGDYIVEGRFGNTIRLGATARSEAIPEEQKNNWSNGSKGEIGDPITIIRNGQAVNLDNQGWVHTLENINTDPSSIYLTSNQKIDNFAIAAPDCWYSFGLNAIIPQNDNEEAKKFLDSPVDFMVAEEVEVEETTPPNEEKQEEINEGQSTSNNQAQEIDPNTINYECPPGQVWNEEIQACALPEVEITGSISEEEAGFIEEEDTVEYYQLDDSQTEPEIIERPPLPESYALATSANNCGNCFFHENNYCNNWKAKVRGNHENPWICNAWKEIKPLPKYKIAGGAREGQIQSLQADGTYSNFQVTLTDSLSGEERTIFFFAKEVGFQTQISIRHARGLVYIDAPSFGSLEELIRVAGQQVSHMDAETFDNAILSGGVGPGK